MQRLAILKLDDSSTMIDMSDAEHAGGIDTHVKGKYGFTTFPQELFDQRIAVPT